MRLPAWLLSRPSKRQCVAGLDVSHNGVWMVVLSGALAGAETVNCCELLDLPDGLVQGALVLDPLALGQWLKRWLHERNLFPEGQSEMWHFNWPLNCRWESWQTPRNFAGPTNQWYPRTKSNRLLCARMPWLRWRMSPCSA
jgi:hypothetical protein